MNFLKYILILTSLSIFISCRNNSTSRTTESKKVATSFINYSPEETIFKVKKEIEFWTKKKEESKNISQYNAQISAAYSRLFDVTGNIHALKEAEKLLKKAVENEILNQAGLYRALAKNYISQHRFKEALELVNLALENGNGKNASNLMLFDIYLELGKSDEAITHLRQIPNKKEFNYLIRKAKWEDHEGNLNKTITFMERAKKIAESSKKKGLMNWVYSNLADYYGHDGQLEKSKAMFYKAIEIDPSDWYSAKGLAWISFSGEQNPKTALEIISKIEKHNKTPDLLLMKAEIENKEGNIALAKNFKKQIASQVSQKTYGVMYNSFLFNYALNVQGDTKTAERLAHNELEVRNTPAAYGLLATINVALGNVEEAKKIAKEHVIFSTYEPQVLTDQLELFADNPIILKQLINQVKDAKFELGPTEYQKIEKYNKG